MDNNSSGNNKRNNKRNGAPQVVVVTKKKFNFASKKEAKVEEPPVVENVADAPISPPPVEKPQEKIDISNHDFNNRANVKSGNKIRNLDQDFSQPSKKKEKPKKKEYTKPEPSIKEEVIPLEPLVKVEKSDKKLKDDKSFLEGIALVSKEKKFDASQESSAFLNNKKDYEAGKKKRNFFDDKNEEQDRLRSIASMKRAREKAKNFGSRNEQADKKVKDVIIPETITVQELANRMAVRSADVVKELMKMGMMITASKPIDADTAELLVAEFGLNAKRVSDSDIENILQSPEWDNPYKLQSRAPVVAVMGHVDHGKTSLLDALRETDIVASESGGITQHIGASRVKVAEDKYITFLDTPGHEAFTAMRLRGAHATDMVILVVAADDGIKDQTVEAIHHAKAAGIPIIVAINKIDKEGANPNRVVTELLEHEVILEAMGGDVLSAEVSALQKTNLDKLIDAILLQTEILELKANPDCLACGIVIESKIDKSKGALASLLTQAGTLKLGDIVLAGCAFGKVRLLTDDKGRNIETLLPSESAEILGLDSAPEAGEKFYVVESEKIARDLIEYRTNKKKDIEAAKRSKKTLEDIFSGMTSGEKKKLPLVIKCDVKGSVEAVVNSLEKLSNDEVSVEVIHAAVGGITESDVILAKASEAIILGFNVRLGNSVSDSESKEVDIRYYSIIYNLVDDIQAAVNGMLKPIIRENALGKGEIREVFNLSKYGKVAGSYVNSGIAKRSGKCRVIRDSVVISETDIKALKHYKDDVKEVKNGSECGISFENCTDFQAGDLLEFYEVIEEKR